MLAAVLMSPLAVKAQSNSSLNTFSPYTFYGLGDMDQVGTAATRSMGGVGLGYWSMSEINLLNPASYSAVPQRSFIFDFGLSGKSNYLKTSNAKSAHNAFNISDVAIQFPLYKGIGFAVSVTPLSSIGYKARMVEDDDDIITDVGYVTYNYNGEGGVSQFKAGLGVQVFKNFSLGADLIYYMGTISRYSGVEITSVGTESFSNITINSKEEISKILFGLGAQYDLLKNNQRVLTLGATYQPKARINSKSIREIVSSTSTDSISYKSLRNAIDVPEKIAAGVFYKTRKLGVGFDYSFQNWKNAFTIPEVDRMTLSKNQNFNFGMQYTPNRSDIRNMFKRWTYRVGVRYSDMYMVRDGEKTNDLALTFGVGVPLKYDGFSQLSVGVELGKRGRTGFTPNNLQLVKDNYFRISVGLSLFGEDYWFVKQKYD